METSGKLGAFFKTHVDIFLSAHARIENACKFNSYYAMSCSSKTHTRKVVFQQVCMFDSFLVVVHVVIVYGP